MVLKFIICDTLALGSLEGQTPKFGENYKILCGIDTENCASVGNSSFSEIPKVQKVWTFKFLPYVHLEHIKICGAFVVSCFLAK